MKKVICALATVFVVFTVWGAPAQPETMSGKTAVEFFADIKAGWNLGNTMDAVNNSTGVAVEGTWGAGRATQALFDGVSQSGFDLVRIPSTWTGHIGDAPDYTIDPNRLARVDTIIGYAKAAGVKSMIINIHHDGHATDHKSWLKLSEAINNSEKKAELQEKLVKVWTQIANYFKNYGDYLIFETLNEVHSGNWGCASAAAACQEQQGILLDWNQAALSAIRATGGNNEKRFVAVPTLGSTEPNMVVSAYNNGKLLPDDPGNNGTEKLIVSVHFYAPWRYTVAGGTTQADSLIHTWGTTAERNALTKEVASLKTTFIDNNIAAYIGEWGAPTNRRRNMSEDIKNTHIDYIKSVATAARQNGVVPIIWDDGGNFKMLERSNGIPAAGLATDVLNAMMEALKGGTSIIKEPHGRPSGIRAISITVKGKTLNVSSADNSDLRIRVVNLRGRTIAKFNTKGSANLSLKKIPAGVYVIEAKRVRDGVKTASNIVLR